MHKQENNISKCFFVIFVLLVILISLLLMNFRVRNKIIPIINAVTNNTNMIFAIMVGRLPTGRKKQDKNKKSGIPEVKIDIFFIFLSILFSIFIYFSLHKKLPPSDSKFGLIVMDLQFISKSL